jgi:NDP-sugar pyrophosphorylase family protein
MQAVILAAGKGTRLHPITLHRSKAMAPVAGKPIVERVMELLTTKGIHQFILVVSQNDAELKHYFLDRPDLPVEIEFVIQTERLGMAHALAQAAPYIHDTFILSACDNLVPVEHVADLLATQQSTAAGATLSLMEIDRSQASRTGIVDIQEGRIRRIVEKPSPEAAPSNISSLPLYVFTPQLLAYLPDLQPSPRGEYELQDLIQRLIDEGYPVNGAFTGTRLQLTTAADLLALNRHYLTLDGETSSRLAPAGIDPQTRLIPPLHIEAGTTIGPGCVIGPHVYIETGCYIGPNVSIKDALILRHTTVEAGRRVVGEVVMSQLRPSSLETPG